MAIKCNSKYAISSFTLIMSNASKCFITKSSNGLYLSVFFITFTLHVKLEALQESHFTNVTFYKFSTLILQY